MIAAVVVVPLVVIQVLGERKRARVIAHLRTLACPRCHSTYGETTVIRVSRRSWDPAPGYYVAQLDLPDPSYFVTCPGCAEELEYYGDGRLFELPDEGSESDGDFLR